MGDHSGAEVDAVVKDTVQISGVRNGASNKYSWGKKNEEQNGYLGDTHF